MPEQQRKDAELQAQFQPFLTAAAQAEELLRQTAARVRTNAQPFLQKINDFQRRSGQLNEEKALQDHQFYSALAQPAPGELLPYTPIPREFMALYEGMYERISEHLGGSFDHPGSHVYSMLARFRGTPRQCLSSMRCPWAREPLDNRSA